MMYERLGDALSAAWADAENRGYVVNMDGVFPSPMEYETSQSLTYPVTKPGKNGKVVHRYLHVSLYRYHTGRYELTSYVS